jgi:diguanylate cyclase (GGDEF)-like protein/PAS domain S-box-containing protein
MMGGHFQHERTTFSGARNHGEELAHVRWFITLRWVALVGIFLAALLARLLTPYEFTPVVVIAMVAAGYNLLLLLHRRFFETRGPLIWPGELDLILNFQIALDAILLAVAIHLTGGVESLLVSIYLVYLPAASLILPRRRIFLQATFALVLLGAVFWLEYTGRLAHGHLGAGVEPDLYSDSAYVTNVLIFQACLLYLATYAASYVGSRIREQRRLLDQLRDFSDSIIDSIGQGVVVLDTQGRVMRFNRFMRDHYGWDESELGRNVFEMRHDLRESNLYEQFRQVLRKGQPAEFRNLRRVTRQGREVYQNLYGYPLYHGDEIKGVVVVVEDVTEQRRAELELQRRTAELDVLHRVALAGAEARSADELLARVTEILAQSIYTDNVGFLLLDEKEQVLRLHPACRGVKPEVRQWRIPVGQGITGTVVQTGEPLLVPDVRKEPRYLEASPTVRSELCVPLRVAGRVVGVLNVESRDLGAFTEKDLHLVMTIAGHVGTALEKLRLFEEIRRHNRELAARNAIAHALSRSLDLDSILEELYREIQRLLSPDTFSIALYDPARDRIEVRLVIEEGKRLPSLIAPLDQAGGLTGWVVRQRQSLLIHDMEAEAERLPAKPRHITRAARSWLGVPLIARDQVVGAMTVQSFRPAAFDEADRDFLTAVAGQVAMAVEKARLLEAERRARQQAEALQRLAATLSSTLELEQLLDLMLEYLEEFIPYDSASVMLVKGDKARVVAARGFPDLAQALAVEVSLTDDRAFQEVVKTHRPVILADAATDPCFRGLGGTDYVRGWICAPLIVRSNVIGLLTVDNRQPGVYDEKDAALVQTFAGHAALAVENARLYQEMRHMALTDGLTGLYNSRHFYRVLEQELLRSERYGHTFSLLMFDLDNFKSYNDRYGHLAGDDLLRELAGLIKGLVRRSDTAFRYGGEEFMLILPETSRPDALVLAERLRQAVQEHAFVVREGIPLGRITISIGVATYPEDARDVEGLVNAADMALLEAKKAKNRVCTLAV